MDPRGDSLDVISSTDWHGLLSQNQAGIDSGINKMHGTAGHFFPGSKSLCDGIETGLERQERGMNVKNATKISEGQALLNYEMPPFVP